MKLVTFIESWQKPISKLCVLLFHLSEGLLKLYSYRGEVVEAERKPIGRRVVAFTGQRGGWWSEFLVSLETLMCCSAEADTGERRFCWSRHVIELVMIRKNIHIILQTMPWSIGSPCSALLIFTYGDFVENNSSKDFSWYSGGFVLVLWICADRSGRLLLTCVWCFGLEANKEDWSSTEEQFVNRSTTPVSY